jgi:hypothetical protein
MNVERRFKMKRLSAMVVVLGMGLELPRPRPPRAIKKTGRRPRGQSPGARPFPRFFHSTL